MAANKISSSTPEPPSQITHARPAAAASLAFLLLVIALVIAQMTPPAASPATAPMTAFSAERARQHLQVIASAPHPTGSAENLRVGTYLFDQLATLGLQPEYQLRTSVYIDEGKWGVAGPRGLEVDEHTWSLAGANVRNVMARIPGSDSTGAVLLMAHYDSVPYGPGASDDGAGTAAILETARALLAGPQLRNDVILLLTDGEEIGLMGSQAFADHHPWMKEVAVVFNLEARGSSGTPIMYETSLNNAWLIQHYARAAKTPVTGSVATDVYRLLPNSSDLTVFLRARVQGLNFAYTDNWTDYHTSHDSLEDLDERSLQHHGDNALALARHFGGLDLSVPSEGDAVFFSIPRLGIIHYPASWALPLAVVAILAFVVVLTTGFRRKSLSVRGIAAGILAVLLSAAAAAIIAFLIVQGLDILKNGELRVGMGGTYNSHHYEAGLLAIYLPVSAFVYAQFQKRTSTADLVMAALFFWLILAIGSSFFLPGGSYLFLWPLLAGLVPLTIELIRPGSRSTLVVVLRLLPLTFGVLLAGTAVYLISVMFGVDGYPATGAFSILILALLFPYLDFRSLPQPAVWLSVPVLVGFAAIGIGATTSYSSAQPRQNTLFYSLNADTGSAAWVARTRLPDASLSPWLDGAHQLHTWEDYFPAAWEDKILASAAPILDQPYPEMTIIADTVSDGARTLRLHLDSGRGAWALMANVTAQGAVLEAELNGVRHAQPDARDAVFFKMIAPPAGGADITITLRPNMPVAVRIADVTPSLPEFIDYPTQINSPLRTGYGGGHGLDAMTLIHREYQIAP